MPCGAVMRARLVVPGCPCTAVVVVEEFRTAGVNSRRGGVTTEQVGESGHRQDDRDDRRGNGRGSDPAS